jgi:hypothetical protein
VGLSVPGMLHTNSKFLILNAPKCVVGVTRGDFPHWRLIRKLDAIRMLRLTVVLVSHDLFEPEIAAVLGFNCRD